MKFSSNPILPKKAGRNHKHLALQAAVQKHSPIRGFQLRFVFNPPLCSFNATVQSLWSMTWQFFWSNQHHRCLQNNRTRNLDSLFSNHRTSAEGQCNCMGLILIVQTKSAAGVWVQLIQSSGVIRSQLIINIMYHSCYFCFTGCHQLKSLSLVRIKMKNHRPFS